MSKIIKECPECESTELNERVTLTGQEGWIRKSVVCSNPKCMASIYSEDSRMVCECGNKTFVTSKVTKNDKEAKEHLGKLSILCSDVIECGKTVAYID